MKRALHRIAYAVGLIAAAAPTVSLAGPGGLIVVPYKAGPSTGTASMAPSAVTVQGASQGHLSAAPLSTGDRVEGFGHDVPLSMAVQQIAPSGFVFSYGAGVDKNRPISWGEGAHWVDVLQASVAAQGMQAEVRGQLVQISLANAPAQAPAVTQATSASAQPVSNLPTQQVAKSSNQPVVTNAAQMEAHSTAPATVQGIWHAAMGQTLGDVLQQWAAHAGWTVVYNSETFYDLQAPVDLEGDFVGAASTLVKSIQAHPRPYATFYSGNHALVITNTPN